ncbi:MAG: efflux RND transporter periplasmic adaptor subunit [Bacteroidales bacterium]|nr:efflux RND transporter periplasmic adaptor subunit [Bacteroidales bacterium]MDD4602754.1 efflux RND transporter periplasmic adaptor subunit [Bacteroidales bacterium]
MKQYISGFLAVIALFTSCSNDKNKPDAYGTFEATEVMVSSLGTGQIMKFYVEEGQVIDSGIMVGYIDTTDLYLKRKQSVETRDATASRENDIASQIAVQEQNRENVLVEKRRVEHLLRDGAATQKQMDDIIASLNLIEKQISSLKIQNGGILNQVASVTQQIAQLEQSISRSRIINPIKGTVLTKYAEKNEVAIYGKPLYKIADLSEIILRAYVGGSQLPYIKLGSTIDVAFDKDEKTNSHVQGVVSWISPSAEFTPKTIQTKEERVNLVYAVKIRVKNDGSIKIGMPGEIRFLNVLNKK